MRKRRGASLPAAVQGDPGLSRSSSIRAIWGLRSHLLGLARITVGDFCDCAVPACGTFGNGETCLPDGKRRRAAAVQGDFGLPGSISIRAIWVASARVGSGWLAFARIMAARWDR